jgi:DNA polymerase III subunit epsilon
MRQVILDTETTGLSAANGDRILEIGCVELVNRKLTQRTLHHYINPERDSHEDALRIHGITTEFLRDKPKFAQVAQEIADFIAGAELIIHNAPFDIGFMDAEFDRVGLPKTREHASGVIDTLAMAKEAYPGKRNNLDALCDRLGVDNSNRTLHGALLDAQILGDVYIAMTRGQHALIDDSPTAQSSHLRAAQIDWGSIRLMQLAPSADELDAHAQYLADLNKASGGKTVWKSA